MNLIPAEGQGLFVLIVLTVRPENQQALIDTIRSAGDPAKVPGLRSINLLRSLDGKNLLERHPNVVAYKARCQARPAFAAALAAQLADFEQREAVSA